MSPYSVSPSDIFLVYSDAAFTRQIAQAATDRELELESFSDFEVARAALKLKKPAVLVVEWNLRDLEAIDFLIHISEDKGWGDMVVYFIADGELSESERFHMMSLGTDQSYNKLELADAEAFQHFIEEVAVACRPPTAETGG